MSVAAVPVPQPPPRKRSWLGLGLLAVATVAAAGCEVHMGTQPAQATQPPAAAPPAAGAAATATAAAPATTAPPRVVSLRLHGAQPAPAGTATPTAPATPVAPATTACFDSGAATVIDCSAVPAPDPGCAATAVAAQRCAAFKTYFAPKVAAAAVTCLAGLTNKQVCDPAAVDACGRNALAQACPDSSIAQLCAVAGTPCRTSATDCTATVSGLSAQGKQQVAQCVATGCTAGLYGCVSGLASTSVALTKQ